MSACVDGNEHVWHFFQRSLLWWRACKKCSRIEMAVEGGFVPTKRDQFRRILLGV